MLSEGAQPLQQAVLCAGRAARVPAAGTDGSDGAGQHRSSHTQGTAGSEPGETQDAAP